MLHSFLRGVSKIQLIGIAFSTFLRVLNFPPGGLRALFRNLSPPVDGAGGCDPKNVLNSKNRSTSLILSVLKQFSEFFSLQLTVG